MRSKIKQSIIVHILPLCFLLFGIEVKAQDGKLLNSRIINYPDSITTPLVKRLPRFQQVFDSTKTLDITYLSQGLKIKGYVIEPKLPGKYPCLIYCRGGLQIMG